MKGVRRVGWAPPEADTPEVVNEASSQASPGTSRNDRRKARTQAAILEAAERVIREQGFERALIEDIAESADVGIGSIYHHFGSKEGLLLALIERAIEVNQRYLEEGFQVEGSPIQRLGATQGAYLRFCVEQPFYFDLIILEYEKRVATYAPDAVSRISAIAQAVLTRVTDLIVEAQTAREIRPVNPEHAARFLWAALNGLLASGRRSDELHLDPDQLKAVLNTGMDIVLEGIATKQGLKHLETAPLPDAGGKSTTPNRRH
jgi:TetR/AcrR family transcriptional regulator